jgi:NADH-quinone oxidoreductase subunit E
MAAKGLDEIIGKYKDVEGGLIPALQQAQELLGYLAPETLDGIAKGLKVPLSRVYSVATFYAQFYLTPRGRNMIKACKGTACHVKGAGKVLHALEDKLNVKAGNCTEDMQFQLEAIACLGTCFLAPAVMINADYYGSQTPKSIVNVIGKYSKTKGKGTDEGETEPGE